MSIRYAEVYIKWFQKFEPISIPPEGIKFHPQVKFEEEEVGMPRWTAVVIIRKWGENDSCYADMTYLVKDAPFSLIQKDKKFALYDGPNLIAKGIVL